MSVDGFSITASVGVSNLAAPIFAGNGCSISSGQTCSSTTASMAFVNVAAPTELLSCVAQLNIVLQIMSNSNSTKSTCTT